jgi:AAA15 family ATPase/GTPase
VNRDNLRNIKKINLKRRKQKFLNSFTKKIASSRANTTLIYYNERQFYHFLTVTFCCLFSRGWQMTTGNKLKTTCREARARFVEYFYCDYFLKYFFIYKYIKIIYFKKILLKI